MGKATTVPVQGGGEANTILKISLKNTLIRNTELTSPPPHSPRPSEMEVSVENTTDFEQKLEDVLHSAKSTPQVSPANYVIKRLS